MRRQLYGKVFRRIILLLMATNERHLLQYTYLAINGLDITATDDEAQDFILQLYETSSVTFDNLRAWLGENTKGL